MSNRDEMSERKFKVGDRVRISAFGCDYYGHEFIVQKDDGNYYYGQPDDLKAAGWDYNSLELVEKGKEESEKTLPQFSPPLPSLSLPLDLHSFVYSLPTDQFQQLELTVRSRMDKYLEVLRSKFGGGEGALAHFATYMSRHSLIRTAFLLIRNQVSAVHALLSDNAYHPSQRQRIIEGLSDFLRTDSELPFCLCGLEQCNPKKECPYYEESDHKLVSE